MTDRRPRFRFWNAAVALTCVAVLSRGLALFLGVFALLNVVGELRTPGFDANAWWINLPGNWHWIERLYLGWSAGCLIWFSCHRQLNRSLRILFAFALGLLITASLWNVVTYQRLLSIGRIQSHSPFPFSAAVALGLSFVMWGLFSPVQAKSDQTSGQTSMWYFFGIVVTGIGLAVLFPVAQMVCFGLTDYRRPADVIVVFGAKVYPDGSLSSVLEERVRTGCELYQTGLASHLLCSGGPGMGMIHETAGMRLRALELGVPSEAILVDEAGWDTDSTTRNTLQLATQRDWKRVLAVSQFYHLPRIKLAFQRQGAEVHTVPAERIYRFRYLPYFMLREVAAWWLYYLRPLWESA